MKTEIGKIGRYVSMAIAVFLVVIVFASSHPVLANHINGQNYILKEISISENSVKYVRGPNGEYLTIDGLRMVNIPGKPVLPFKTVEVMLPHNAMITDVTITNKIYKDYLQKVKISPGTMPVLKDGRELPNIFSIKDHTKRIYSQNTYYPQREISYRIGKTNYKTIVYVYVYPVRYNPVESKVRILTSGEIKVSYTLVKEKILAPPINVPNVIITSPELKEQAQRLADFHNSTGITSWVVTTSWISNDYDTAPDPPVNGYGNDTTDYYSLDYPGVKGYHKLNKDMIIGYDYTLARKIVSFLKDEMGGNVKYVTLFGNARMVPPSYYWTDQYMYILAYLGYGDYYDAWIPTDVFYASPDYNSTSFDYTPNFEVGRIPVNPLTAKITVDKIIYYGTHKHGGILNITLSGGQVFETPYFLGETSISEPLNYGWLNGLRVTEYFHTLRNYTYDNFIKMMNDSDMIIETTHGSGFSFWHHNDEISAWDFSIRDDYGSLPIYISGSCLNGAWDEEVYPSYDMSYGINGGTSIAEKLIYSPKGAIAYMGGDREAYGSTYAYFDNGTLVAPNDFGDLITTDGSTYGYYRALSDNGVVYLGDLAYWAWYKYPGWVAAIDGMNISAVDPYESGLNDNPWARSYFEYSLLGDPALMVAGGGGGEPTYDLPKVEVMNAEYNAQLIPMVKRGETVAVNISTNSPKVKVELLYLENDMGYSPYYGDNVVTYYDFIMDTRILSISGGSAVYTFTPNREGTYIVSVYGEDGKNSRLYILCEKPTPPPLKPFTRSMKFMDFNGNKELMATGIKVVTILDYGDISFGKYTNATAVLYNAGDSDATNVNVDFYLENYTLIFKDNNLNNPLISLGSVSVGNIPAHGYAYATISWKAVDLYTQNHAWDPYHSSARWQYFVAKTSSSANWALLRVHLDVDVWAQKVFIEKEPVYGMDNNITVELTNVGTNTDSQTTVVVKDDFGVIATLNTNILPGETVFLKIPWTPQGYGVDNLSVNTSTVGDINVRNDNSSYYPNGYNGVTEFKVLYYDISPVNISQNDMNLTIQMYNHGPQTSQPSSVDIYQIPGACPYVIESPHPYPNNYDHKWNLTVPGATQLTLHFKYIDVEQGYDYLYIKDSSGSIVTKYTGYHTDVWTPLVRGSKVYIELVSDIYVNATGFYMDMYSTNPPTYIYIGTSSFGQIVPGDYDNSTIKFDHIVSGYSAFKLVASSYGDVATLSTGGEGNNNATVSATIQEVNDPSTIPQISILSPSENTVVKSSVTLWLKLNDSIAAMVYDGRVTIDGTVSDVKFVLQSNWTLKGTLNFESDGTHTISLYVIDGGGHQSNTVTLHIISDSTAPVIAITSPGRGEVIGNTSVTIQWSVEESNLDHIEISGVTEEIGPSINSYTINGLSDGVQNITITAVDKAGNSGSDWVEFTVDTHSPEVVINIPNNESVVNTSRVNIGWSVSDATLKSVFLWVDSGNKENVTSMNNKIIDMQDGLHYIYIQAEDRAGHITTRWVLLTVDTTAPSVSVITPTSGTIVRKNIITITITFSEGVNVSTLKYHITGGEYTVHMDWESNNTKLVITISNLEMGKTYQFIIDSVKDVAGNELSNYDYTFKTAVSSETTKPSGGIDMTTIAIVLAIIVIIIAIVVVAMKKKGENSESERETGE